MIRLTLPEGSILDKAVYCHIAMSQIDKNVNEPPTMARELRFSNIRVPRIRNVDKNEKKRLTRWLNSQIESLVLELMNEVESELQKRPLSAISADRLIGWAETLANLVLAHGLRTNQIRKFFDGVKRIGTVSSIKGAKTFDRDQVVFLKASLAYTASRGQTGVGSLMMVLSEMIDALRDGEDGYEDFKQFERFVETLIAYHKFYGGKDK